jgi:hypothetical protein
VHSGQLPDDALWDEARAVTVEIALSLFRLQKSPENLQPGTRERWLTQLDFICASIDAERNVAEDDLVSVGIATSGSVDSSTLNALLTARAGK